MTFTEKDLLIIAQSTSGHAATIVAALVGPETSATDAATLHAEVHEAIYASVVLKITTEQGSEKVQATFPGAEASPGPQYQPPQPSAPPAPQAPPVPQAPAPAPAPAPPAQAPVGPPPQVPGQPPSDDELWRGLIDEFSKGNLTSWYDNRKDKRSQAAPDFRHKTLMSADGKFKLGLWIGGRGTPQWVKEYFAQAEAQGF